MLTGKKILLGVCGSIAAYKSALLIRLLVKAGCEVRVVMTHSAKSFITPLTLATLSKHPAVSSFEKDDQGQWENHVELGLWADLFLVAPASANTIAKMAHGMCDNLLSAVYLSVKCPVMIAPAMDLDMYKHPATQQNLQTLQAYGHQVLDTEHGELASGLVGEGRMAEPEHLLQTVEGHFNKKKRFEGKQVLITAGPTYEKIDPVRFIGNHSSGKMGLALAHVFASEGAQVQLIAGPGNYLVTSEAITVTRVSSADDMFDAVSSRFDQADVSVFAAAVADYRPAAPAEEKIKKSGESMTIELVKNKDIAAEMGKRKVKNQINVGFALETEREEEYAQEKMAKKNFDMIVLNSLNDNGAGFSVDTNKITIFSVDQKPKLFPLKTKQVVAEDIVNCIYEKLQS
ncbi:bifunctional phosphopantothenoylcysteine decarboxylase/phosphopantothenate--cysteine ligase CoaBC [Reichenbachiella carrageenanivorans]|uniref:Coenzyme A biosynthesis bifunctional protein CoaBC n=1 Tax=Reichenbachiella carrageenanivorans TaxID=2979869 RepID=A0ABY6D5Y0_9BACT|nr:bifunctional phosphopantothenoylcysteine decarboxylase/phosphopantothenate--cysteine ligase CoaBC [Reichenbachiella carrageenanivorans]UXX79250.1 bifunctional phosphopantothenoylcysteine decarboxylase/phosphopantothenate--cysteine ligase CoaBC [Reichenbachiella carrageenanivorans]